VNDSKPERAILSSPDDLGAEMRRDKLSGWWDGSGSIPPEQLKQLWGWLFLAQAVLRVREIRWLVFHTVYQGYASTPSGTAVTGVALLLAFSVIDGVAWWAIWRKLSSARVWGVNASGVNILLFFWQFVFPTPRIWDHHAAVLLCGIFGLYTFLRRDEPRESSAP
jgi:hypothetical protein